MTFIFARPPVVLDASVAVSAVLPGEATGMGLFDQWHQEERITLVPATFWAEAANAVLVGNRVDATKTQTFLELLASFGVEVADRRLHGVLEAVDLAARHGLTVYDAVYLQLALDVEGSLATLDNELARAARQEGVELEAT